MTQSKAEIRTENRARVLLTLNAIGHKISIKDLQAQPALSDMTTQQIGQTLRWLKRDKEVRHLKAGLWAPLTKRSVKEEAPKEQPSLHFVLNPIKRTIQLDVEGWRLPVLIDMED